MNDKLVSWMMSIGLILFVAHVRLPDTIMQYLFLPWIGIALLTIAVFYKLGKKGEKWELGEKKVWIPLAVIVLSIIGSGVEGVVEKRFSINQGIADASMGLLLFGIYMVSRKLGDSIFKAMPYVVVIESASIIIWGAFNDWQPNGGIISPPNYDIATGLLVFCTLVSPTKYQWWLSTIAVIGLFFTGSGEAYLAIGILFIAVLIRKDWSWKLALPVSLLVITIVGTTLLGITHKAQLPMLARIGLAKTEISGGDTKKFIEGDITRWIYLDPSVSPNTSVWDKVFGFRFSNSKLTMPIKPFGYGLNLTNYYWGIPHNVILIIIEQIGILAALAWVVLMMILFKTTRYKYLIIGFAVGLGLLDHYIFTQAAVWMPAMVGAITASSNRFIGKDYIFRRIK